MRAMVALFITIFSQWASAGPQCAAVFEFDTPLAWKAASDRVFKKNMVGADASENELYFYWHTAYPTELKKRPDGKLTAVHSSSRMRLYHNHHDLSVPEPLQAVNTLFGSQDTSNQRMLRGFIENYKERVSEEIIQEVKAIEDLIASLSDNRQSFGYVASAPAEWGGILFGTFRVFNGTQSHSQSSPLTPMERSFLLDGVNTKTAERLAALRKLNPNTLIFEIGKFSVNAPAKIARRVRNMLELFFLRYYVDALPPDAHFFVHAVTEAHVRLYVSRYGFHVVEEVKVPGQVETEYILEANGEELRQAFEKIHGLPRRGIEILNP
jgi:hypothetical protein